MFKLIRSKQRCISKTKHGMRCKKCNDQNNLRIKPSTIPNTGLELFSYKLPFKQYKLGRYTGKQTTNQKLEKKIQPDAWMPIDQWTALWDKQMIYVPRQKQTSVYVISHQNQRENLSPFENHWNESNHTQNDLIFKVNTIGHNTNKILKTIIWVFITINHDTFKILKYWTCSSSSVFTTQTPHQLHQN